MLLACDDDRHLAIAEFGYQREGLRVLGDIDNGVSDPLPIKGASGGGALDAGGLGIDSDRHGFLVMLDAEKYVRPGITPEWNRALIDMDLVNERSPNGYGSAMIWNCKLMAFTPKQTI